MLEISQPEFTHLLGPFTVGQFSVRNRVLITAHATNYVDADGLPDDRAVAYYAERARGGAGLMCTGASTVDPGSARERGAANAYDPRAVERWRAIAETVHAEEGRIMVMLTHFGRVGRTADGAPLVAPSPLMDGNYHQAVPHELTVEEIGEIVQAFATCAGRVRQSGMDGVELQGAHGYLIAQFLSPASNVRSDAYGGGLDGRLRFCLEVLEAVRRAVGHNYTVGIRLSGDELIPGGIALSETCEVARRLEASGLVDFLDISGGTDADLMSLAEHIPPMYIPPGNLVHLAAAVKEVTRLPVFCVGGIRDPLMAEQIVASGHADMVGMTRAHIADPHIVAKLRAGQYDDIRRCIGCMQACTEALAHGGPISCVYNPVTGREREWASLQPAAAPRRVVVVGGGPAGLEAARVAALRGHRVTLFEASHELGGQLLLAAALPKRDNFLDVVRWLSAQARKAGVELRVGQSVDGEEVLREAPDAVVLATGARAELPSLPGAEGRLLHVRDAIVERAPVGRRVLVVDVDGHLRGCGTADLLASQGRQVRICSEQVYVGHNIDQKTLYPLYRRLRQQGVEMLPGTRFEGWEEGESVVSDIFTGARRRLPEVETVIWADAGRANDSLLAELRGAGLKTHAVGDCVAPRRLESAVREAHAVARAL